MPDKYEFMRMGSRDIALEIVYLSQILDNSRDLTPLQIQEINLERHVLCKVLGYSGWDFFLKHGQREGFLVVEKTDLGIDYCLI